MISQAYQGYSNRRARELSNVIAYLNEQINKIKPQALASSQAAVDYGYENGLGILDGLPLAGRVSGAGVSKDGGGQGISIIGSGRNVEASRHLRTTAGDVARGPAEGRSASRYKFDLFCLPA